MALYSVRIRRTLATLSSFHRYVSATPAISSSSYSFPSSIQPLITSPLQSQSRLVQNWPFRTSSLSFSSARSSYGNNTEDDKIGPDTILFEGCDYNHWLITMDFPKDPKPTAEEMVRTYEETCAKGLNISVEEAKKKMYACSTTTYQGFQAIMTEEESEKFRGLPGVVFILPDSYIDPQNKEYGGDKYINGTIIPRPPPVQYGRQGGRYRDRNRNTDQPRYDRQGGSTPNWQGNPNPSYNQQVPMQGDGRNYSPQQNYGPPGQGERRDSVPMNNRDYVPGGRDAYQGGRAGPMPSYQGNYNQGGQGSYNQGGQGSFNPQGDRRDTMPPGQRDFRGDNRGYDSAQGGTYRQGGYEGQGTSSGYGPSYPGQGQSYPGQGQNYPGQGQSYPGQGPSYPGQGPSYPGPGRGQGQGFAQGDGKNTQGEQRNYPPVGQTGNDQGR